MVWKGDFINYMLPVWQIAPLWGNFWQISWCASPQLHIQVIWTWPIMNKTFPATEHWFCIIINQGLTAEYRFCIIINWGLKVTAVWQVFSNHLLAVSAERPRTGRAGSLNTSFCERVAQVSVEKYFSAHGRACELSLPLPLMHHERTKVELSEWTKFHVPHPTKRRL